MDSRLWSESLPEPQASGKFVLSARKHFGCLKTQLAMFAWTWIFLRKIGCRRSPQREASENSVRRASIDLSGAKLDRCILLINSELYEMWWHMMTCVVRGLTTLWLFQFFAISLRQKWCNKPIIDCLIKWLRIGEIVRVSKQIIIALLGRCNKQRLTYWLVSTMSPYHQVTNKPGNRQIM